MFSPKHASKYVLGQGDGGRRQLAVASGWIIRSQGWDDLSWTQGSLQDENWNQQPTGSCRLCPSPDTILLSTKQLTAPLMNLLKQSRLRRASLLKFLLSAELKAKFGASTDGGVPGGWQSIAASPWYQRAEPEAPRNQRAGMTACLRAGRWLRPHQERVVWEVERRKEKGERCRSFGNFIFLH